MVHEAAFTDQSPELASLMRGEVSEGMAGKAKWEDVDKGTFIRFAPLVYISTPKMIVKPSAPPAAIDQVSLPPSPAMIPNRAILGEIGIRFWAVVGRERPEFLLIAE